MLNDSKFDWSCHCGLIRPKILIPETLARQLPHKSLVAIVEHELRHVQRWDGLLLSLLAFRKCMHWFNPIVYWCERNVRQSIEHGVDRSTLQTLGASNTQAYGELRKSPPNIEYRQWDARNIGEWVEVLDGADAIVNLTGRTVNCIKTPNHQDEILRSRVESMLVLVKAMRHVSKPPSVWVQMSTAHIYGDPPSSCVRSEKYLGCR